MSKPVKYIVIFFVLFMLWQIQITDFSGLKLREWNEREWMNPPPIETPVNVDPGYIPGERVVQV